MNKKNRKKILFVHQNFPAQYKHIVSSLSKDNFDVHTLSISEYNDEHTTNHHYKIDKISSDNIHEWAVEFESKMIRAEAASKKAIEIKNQGFYPDLIIAHPGWGETFFFKEIWPDTKILSYAEFYYKTVDCDIDFDIDFLENELERNFEEFHEYNKFKLSARNSAFVYLYAMSDYLVTPTNFQKNLLPTTFNNKVEVIHDGIDTDILKPNDSASIRIGNKKFTKSDNVITYVSRSLDPYRGFHIFMRSIPKILKENPTANIIIVGNAETNGYGAPPPNNKKFKDMFLSEIENEIDQERLFFVGQVPYDVYINIIQLSTAHIYLTYPFVLSWSMLEAMSCGALIIGSDTAPVTEVISDNKNGLLVNFFDSDEIANKVNKVINKPNKYNKIRDKARETILNSYDLKTVCLPKHLDLIKKVLEL